MNIVDFIKSEMEKRGITYDQLAASLGMSKPNLWDKLNKGRQPYFESVKKILAGLDYEITVEKTEDAAEIVGDGGLQALFDATEDEQVSYECVKKLLGAMGYEIKLISKK